MRWIFLVLIVLPLWACSEKKEEVTENYSPDTIEADALGAAYNRTKFIEQRKAMMQKWADYLDDLKVGAKIIQLIQA